VIFPGTPELSAAYLWLFGGTHIVLTLTFRRSLAGVYFTKRG